MAEKKRPDSLDLFAANSIYPDAEAIFSTPIATLEEIKNTCYVILDTSALLVPYSVGKNSLEEIRQTYNRLTKTGRLVIPGQVAREFAKNRAEKVKDLYQQLYRSRNKDSSPSLQGYPLLESLEQYQLALRLKAEIEGLLKQYRDAIGAILEVIGSWSWDDPVSQLYRQLFATGVVLDLPIDRTKVVENLEWRFLHHVPPGFKDESKPHGGAGDVLIWHTILEVGRKNKQDVIFVSGDKKTDWRYQSEHQALFPRHELIDEFRRESEGRSFHIVEFPEFLRLYGASEDAIEEARQGEAIEEARLEEAQGLDFETPQYPSPIMPPKILFTQKSTRYRAILDKLRSLYHIDIMVPTTPPGVAPYDLSLTLQGGTNILVKIVETDQPFAHYLKAPSIALSSEASRLGAEYLLVVDADNKAVATELARYFGTLGQSVPDKPILIGYYVPETKLFLLAHE